MKSLRAMKDTHGGAAYAGVVKKLVDGQTDATLERSVALVLARLFPSLAPSARRRRK